MPYPFTPYHLGPSCFAGLILRKWVDFPVFVLSNFAIDFAVLILGLWQSMGFVQLHVHSILIGALVGIIWGIVAYFFKKLFIWIMIRIRLAYQTNIGKMILSGVLGAWLHIFVDSLYQPDINLLWPCRLLNLSFRLNRRFVDVVLILCFAGAIIFYFFIHKSQKKRGKMGDCKTRSKEGAPN